VFRELEKSAAESNRRFCLQLVELLHCLMQAFPGFPDLYEPVLVLLQVLPEHLLK
jgi:hypothetical protein